MAEIGKPTNTSTTSKPESESTPKPKPERDGLQDIRDRLEDVCDYLYGTNVRPPLKKREEGVYAAEVRPSNLNDDQDGD